MSRSLTIENDTHWKSSDILRIVRAARDHAGADPKRGRRVTVKWQTRNASQTSYQFLRHDAVPFTEITIWLPKKGPKVSHPNTMIALAAAGIDTDTTLLAVSDSYFLANALAWEFAREACNGNLVSVLGPMKKSVNPPNWGDGETLVISKYADPAKDGTFMDYVTKKEKDITAAQSRVDKWETELEHAKRNLAKARKDLKSHQRSLADAKKRRGL